MTVIIIVFSISQVIDCIMKFACCVAILHQALLIQTCLQEMYIPMGSRKK